jgi:hypothetical protein
MIFRKMNQQKTPAALPSGSALFVDSAAQENSLFQDHSAEFHNELYTA